MSGSTEKVKVKVKLEQRKISCSFQDSKPGSSSPKPSVCPARCYVKLHGPQRNYYARSGTKFC
jgi:hypothetical protein